MESGLGRGLPSVSVKGKEEG
eukprot:COSAG04_NODE_25390_length_308_cov_0.746411_2_plen_20_part_01